MSYLVDTDWIVDYLYGNAEARDLLVALRPEGLTISIITFLEIYEGIYLSRNPRRAEGAFRLLLQDIGVRPISRTVARYAARVRGQLRRQGAQINHRALDLIIAATAIAHNLELVTRNTKDYNDVPGLRLNQP